jgi:hypothetical protein
LPAASSIDVFNGSPLLGRFSHRYSTGDLESVRMIGDRRVLIATFEAGLGDFLNRRIAIAQFGVHLEIAAVLSGCWTRQFGIHQNPANLRTAEKMLPQSSSPVGYLRGGRFR